MKKEMKSSILSRRWTAFVLVFVLVSGIFIMPVKVYANPYGGGDGNCTYTAWRLAYENTGIQLPGWGNACTWYDSAHNAGYTVSTVPRAKSIAVWSGGSGGMGHVAYVSQVSGNQIYIHEGGYDGGYHEGWENAYGQTKYYSLNHLTMVGYIYLGNGSVGNSPKGCLDVIEGRTNAVYVKGWVFDADDISKTLEINIYVGGPMGSGEGHKILANQYRGDVNNVYGSGDYHGFDAEIPTSLLGNQEVYVYAINIGSGENLLMGTTSVNIVNANNPQGCLDRIQGGNGFVNVRGWVFDVDDVSKALEIHVYIGGPAGIGEYHKILANQYRDDVNDAYNVGNYHGFDAEISTSLLGNQEVYVYAINIGSGGNLLMGAKRVAITDKEESEDVFQIEDGVLVGYNGEGGDVVIPEGVTSIGAWAFNGCNALVSITMPESVISIGDGAFAGCSSLTSITLPESVTDIGGSAFVNCSSLTSIILPESVTGIGSGAFMNCSSLLSITLPESVTGIESSVFSDCSSLTSIILPASVTSIGYSAFENCSSLTSITLPESITRIEAHTFSGCSALKGIVIPENVTSIGYSAFENCNGLVSITLPESVTRIEENWIFSGCSSLKGIIIPKNVTYINVSVFSGCSNLESIEVDARNPVYDSRENCNAIIKTESNTLILGCENTSIPSNVVSIGNSAFSGCRNLTSITIPESVTSIGDETFSGCNSLVNITIPKNVTSIGVRAFVGCKSLANITIPKNVTSIGFGAFGGTPWLETERAKNPLVIVGHTLIDGGMANGDVVIPESVTSINDDAFYGCSSLTGITIPESVTHIGSYAFRDCSSLASITLPESVTSIGYGAFRGTPWLETERAKNPLVIAGHILIDGEMASGDVVIPEGVTRIEDSAFSDCDSLTSVIIPESVTSIGGGAFYGCNGLANVTIPESVTSIEGGAFSGTPWLKAERVKNPLVIINHILIDGETASGDVIIPEGITSIGDSAFRFGINGCDNLTSITIPEGVTYIGKWAFENCNSLKNITIPESVTHIGDGAFNGYADDFAISITAGSYAETYAKNNDIPYRHIEESGQIHSYQNQITTQPGCTTAGVRTYTCSGCGDSYTETIAATGHKYTKTTTNPTCTAKGATTYTCSVCKHSYKEEIAATGHKYTKTTTNPTCTAKGATTYTCSVCKHSYKEEIAATGHKYTKTTTNPSCTVNGAVTCTCSVCKHSYIEKTLPATGHKYVTTTVAATMGKNGVITTSCQVCKKKKQTAIDAPKTVSLSKTESTYNGRQQEPGVTVKDVKGKILRNGSDYTVFYQKDMKNVGTHIVTVNFMGNYSGKTEMIFNINPKGTSISKVKPGKKGFELKWKKQSSQTTGYEIAYSTSNKFPKKNTKTLTVKKSKTTSKTVSKLKAKKKYYVRIRTYKIVTVNGKSTKLYSVWSRIKTVKTKK